MVDGFSALDPGNVLSTDIRAMSDTAILALSWIFFILHLAVVIVTARHWSTLPLVPFVNAVTAAGVLIYWMTKWYSYLFQGIKWYATDQAIPLYALVVITFSLAALLGTFKSTVLNNVFLGIDGSVLLAAALFFTFFRMDRMI